MTNSSGTPDEATLPPQVSDGAVAPGKLPAGIDVAKYRATPEGIALAGWVKGEYEKAKSARKSKELQWYTNLSMVLGNQWVRRTDSTTSPALVRPQTPYYRNRKTVNRLRAFTRWELSKFVSQTPSITSVPGTGTDEDIRASYAAEQVWESLSTSKHLRATYTNAAWWAIHTGNGFIKTEWDRSAGPVQAALGEDGKTLVEEPAGDIRFSCITPFNLFVPDMKESEIEEQPFIFFAYAKNLQWIKTFYRDELQGVDLTASVAGSQDLLDPAYLNATQQQQGEKTACIVVEAWVKPGACDLLPQGGLVTMVDDTLLYVSDTGMPYAHDQYPVAHIGHLYTGGFYRDSPLVDLLPLQKEFNTIRSDISEAGRRMARPQLLVQKGSVVVQKITNEPGLAIEYLPGAPAPTPMPMPELPSYFIQQQDRVLQDFDDISGQRDVTTGQAPAGVTAGTAISYLQEAANQYLTPQYQSIEHAWERVANQTIALFVQYVDQPRKIKIAGADQTFDVELLSGADLAAGTDLRVEAGSSVAQSKAANDAKVMDMFSMGIIDQPMASKMLEVGGYQRMMDIAKAAEKKAQRENIKMKQLDLATIQAAAAEDQQQILQEVQANPEAAAQFDPQMLESLPPPAVVQVADFDIHETHITVHNQFRMSQEYESLAPEVQQQFEVHVQDHQRYLQQQQMQQFLQQVPSDGSDGSEPTADLPPDQAAAAGAASVGAPPDGSTLPSDPAGAPAPTA